MASNEDTSNFFKRADYNEDYWNSYLAARPHYDAPFYQSIYDYHGASNGLTETAHDVATGPGQVAAELSRHFDHVVASDTNATHLAVAGHRLGPLVSSDQVTLVQCPAEEVATAHPPGTVDLITAAECLPLIDAERALEAFATVLRPRGTLAIWFYGRPVFAEPEYATACQPLLASILDRSFGPLIRGGGLQHRAGWKRATDRMTSFLDDVELPADVWGAVERRKWNAEFPMPFYGPEACDFDIAPASSSSRVGAAEKVVHVRDRGFWERQWDLPAVRRFVRVNLPTFDEREQDEGLEGLYEKLGQAMGGEGAVRKITWPVVLILASKK